MIFNLWLFQLDIRAKRKFYTKKAIFNEVAAIRRSGNKLAAIKRYRELMVGRGEMPTLMESKAFVDSIPQGRAND